MTTNFDPIRLSQSPDFYRGMLEGLSLSQRTQPKDLEMLFNNIMQRIKELEAQHKEQNNA